MSTPPIGRSFLARAVVLGALLGAAMALSACTMTDADEPRYTPLPLFHPHRTDFTCIHQADVVPPIDPEADQWFHEALRITSFDLWDNERDYARAAELWARAGAKKHWKAQLNLATLYGQGQGVPKNEERAATLIEEAMRWGVPDAWFVMGTYHINGVAGLKPDATVAYAFWQRAGDMGSPRAQAYLGDKLRANYDSPKNGFWANRPIGKKMLECAYAQGNGDAAYSLGREHRKEYRDTRDAQFLRKAFALYHDGVKLGCAECARDLYLEFKGPNPLDTVVPAGRDLERSKRYVVFEDALERNPILRFPNLDKVLPPPPAKLPPWDGKPESLIDAAKPVIEKAPMPKVAVVFPHSPLDIGPTGIDPARFEIPEGFGLGPWNGTAGGAGGVVMEAGYYQPTLADRVAGHAVYRLDPASHRYLDEPRLTPPAFFEPGERLPDLRQSRLGQLHPAFLEGLEYRFFGLAQALPAPERHPRAVAGLFREAAWPKRELTCRGDVSCPKSGIWQASLGKDHPMLGRFPDRIEAQAFVAKGEPFPVFGRMAFLGIAADELSWQLIEPENAT